MRGHTNPANVGPDTDNPLHSKTAFIVYHLQPIRSRGLKPITISIDMMCAVIYTVQQSKGIMQINQLFTFARFIVMHGNTGSGKRTL